jgi:tetratricopeptide (TPR) repeat protein
VSDRRIPWEESNEAGLRAFRAGRYDEAELHFRRAVEEAEQEAPGGAPVAKALNNLAETYRVQRKYAGAEAVYRHALAIKQQVLGAEHPDVATGLGNLGGLRYALGDLAGAEKLFKRALAIIEGSLGPDHPEAAKAVSNLAGVFFMQGRAVEAEALYRCALAIREKALGPSDAAVAGTLSNLATVCRAVGKLEEAEAFLARAALIDTGTQAPAVGPDKDLPSDALKPNKGTEEP